MSATRSRALRVSASLFGWTLTLLPRLVRRADWPALLGIDRDADRAGAEREEPECLGARGAPSVSWRTGDPRRSSRRPAARRGTGAANRLSPGHVEWPIIDEVTRRRRTQRQPAQLPAPSSQSSIVNSQRPSARTPGSRAVRKSGVAPATHPPAPQRGGLRRAVVAAARAIPLDAGAARPAAPPWDARRLAAARAPALFVHRVDGLTPGVYAYPARSGVLDEWRAAMRPEFLWEAGRRAACSCCSRPT